MPLSNAQAATFATALAAETDATLVNRRNARAVTRIADFYNANSAVIVWKPSVTKAEVLEQIAIADLFGLTADQRGALMVYLTGEIIPCDRARVRAAFASLFGVTGSATRLLALWKRPATRAEAIFATGGAGDDANPHDLKFIGSVSDDEVIKALG